MNNQVLNNQQQTSGGDHASALDRGEPRLRTKEILLWLMKEKAISVYDVMDHWKVKKSDASERLRKLHNAEWVTRASANRPEAEACADRIRQKIAERKTIGGRKAHIYVLSLKGLDYASELQIAPTPKSDGLQVTQVSQRAYDA